MTLKPIIKAEAVDGAEIDHRAAVGADADASTIGADEAEIGHCAATVTSNKDTTLD